MQNYQIEGNLAREPKERISKYKRRLYNQGSFKLESSGLHFKNMKKSQMKPKIKDFLARNIKGEDQNSMSSLNQMKQIRPQLKQDGTSKHNQAVVLIQNQQQIVQTLPKQKLQNSQSIIITHKNYEKHKSQIFASGEKKLQISFLTSNQTSTQYEVQSIEGCRVYGGQKQYLIKWRNYPNIIDWTWEGVKHLENIKDIIKQFDRLKREQIKLRKSKQTSFPEKKKKIYKNVKTLIKHKSHQLSFQEEQGIKYAGQFQETGQEQKQKYQQKKFEGLQSLKNDEYIEESGRYKMDYDTLFQQDCHLTNSWRIFYNSQEEGADKSIQSINFLTNYHSNDKEKQKSIKEKFNIPEFTETNSLYQHEDQMNLQQFYQELVNIYERAQKQVMSESFCDNCLSQDNLQIRISEEWIGQIMYKNEDSLVKTQNRILRPVRSRKMPNYIETSWKNSPFRHNRK